MLWINVPFIHGWSESAAGLSEMKPIADRLRAEAPRGRVIFFDPKGDKPVTMDLNIYLNRVVMPVPVAPADPAAQGLGAMVVVRRPGDGEPAFAGWSRLFDTISLKHHYHFYVFVPK